MTVTSDVSTALYAGNGSTTVFPVPFYFLVNGDVLVQKLTGATGIVSTLVLNSDYTLAGAGVEAGGSLTMAVAPLGGTPPDQLYLSRNVDAVQETAYPSNSPFPASSHEMALDRLTMIAQQDRAKLATALQLSPLTTQYDLAGGRLVNSGTAINANDLPSLTQVQGLVAGATSGLMPSLIAQYPVLAASGGASLMGFLQKGSGAVAIPVQSKLRQSVHIEDFGADPTGVSDSTTPLANAVAAVGANGKVLFGTGTYKFNSGASFSLPAGPAALFFEGQGPSSTVLYWPTATSCLTFSLSNQAHSFHLRGLAITTGLAGTATAVTATQSSPLGRFETNTFYALTFRGNTNTSATYWGTGCAISNVSGTSWDSVTFLGGTGGGGGTGISFTGTGVGGVGGSNYSIYHNVSKCIFNSLQYGLIYGAYSQGITVSQSNFQNTQYGVYSPSAASGTGQSQLNLLDNQFNCFFTAILLQATGNGNITIEGNDIIVPATSNDNAISIAGCVYGTIFGNSINAQGSTLTYGVALSGCSYFNITGNLFDTFANAVLLTGVTVGCTVSCNTYNACTVNVQDSSSSATNSVYFDMATAIANLTVTASPFTHTAGSSPEIHYVFGGTVSNVSKGAVFTATASPTIIHLKPHEAYTVTYSVAPNISFEKQ